jgi:alpha-L-fucosidase
MNKVNRRRFLSTAAQVSLVAAAIKPGALDALAAPSPHLATPSPEQAAWQDLELGMFVHFAPNTWQNVESDNLTTPLSEIDPKELNTDQWAQTAVNLGAKYIVFVAKHQGGFCMWQTDTTDYSIKNTPWKNGKGDVLAEVVASCNKFGLKVGVYVCPRDDHFGATTGGICKTPELQKKYNAMYREQLTEVFTRYGKLVEIWFDGSSVTPVADLLVKYQSHAMIFQGPSATIHWVGNEDGFAPYPCWNGISMADAKSGTSTALNSDPDGNAWMPSEVDVSIRRPDWFWSTTNESKVLTLDQLLSIYYRSVGRGAQLLLNIPANRHGLLSDKDCAVAKSFGTEIKRRFGTPIAVTTGIGTTITVRLPKPTRIDTVILQEEIRKGERVRSYQLQGHIDGTWKNIGSGTAIGHKHIEPVGRVTVDAVRFIATVQAATPSIRTFAIFDTGTAPPADWNAPSEMWSQDLVGDWAAGAFTLDLTDKIKSAAQYRLRFVPKQESITAIQNVVLKLHGSAEPSLIKPSKSKRDELILDITEIGGTVQVTGTIVGATSGQILLQKL